MAKFGDAIIIALRVIEIRPGLRCGGAALKYLCSGLLERDFEIPLVEYHKRLTCFHQLIIVDVDALNSSRNASTDLVHMRCGISVIGRFEIAGVQPVQKYASDH